MFIQFEHLYPSILAPYMPTCQHPSYSFIVAIWLTLLYERNLLGYLEPKAEYCRGSFRYISCITLNRDKANISWCRFDRPTSTSRPMTYAHFLTPFPTTITNLCELLDTSSQIFHKTWKECQHQSHVKLRHCVSIQLW